MRLAPFVLAAASVIAASPSARANPVCTKGTAQALSQVLPIAAKVISVRGNDHARLVEGLGECQYRLFADGATFTFSEDDYFVGGVVWLSDYKESQISRQSAVNDTNLIQDRAWLAKLDANGNPGPVVEQVLQRTAFKDVMTQNLGLVVYQQRSFIAKLPPGRYVSYWRSSYPGEEDATATVYLNVTAR